MACVGEGRLATPAGALIVLIGAPRVLARIGKSAVSSSFAGGGEGNRTPGLNSAIVALYQLSYTPAGRRSG